MSSKLATPEAKTSRVEDFIEERSLRGTTLTLVQG